MQTAKGDKKPFLSYLKYTYFTPKDKVAEQQYFLESYLQRSR